MVYCFPLQSHFVIHLECIFEEQFGLLQLKVFIPNKVICQHLFSVCLLTVSKTGNTGNQITLD